MNFSTTQRLQAFHLKLQRLRLLFHSNPFSASAQMKITATNRTKLRCKPPFNIRVATRSSMQFQRLRRAQLTLVSFMNLARKRITLSQCVIDSTIKVVHLLTISIMHLASLQLETINTRSTKNKTTASINKIKSVQNLRLPLTN